MVFIFQIIWLESEYSILKHFSFIIPGKISHFVHLFFNSNFLNLCLYGKLFLWISWINRFSLKINDSFFKNWDGKWLWFCDIKYLIRIYTSRSGASDSVTDSSVLSNPADAQNVSCLGLLNSGRVLSTLSC